MALPFGCCVSGCGRIGGEYSVDKHVSASVNDTEIGEGIVSDDMLTMLTLESFLGVKAGGITACIWWVVACF